MSENTDKELTKPSSGKALCMWIHRKSDVNTKASSLKMVANAEIKLWCKYLYLHVHTDTF